MAKSFNLQYHEDPGPKGSLTKEAAAFLSGLAKELRTQDSYGNAEPRYFGLMHKEEYPADEDHADGIVVVNDEGETCFHDTPEDLARLMGKLKNDIAGFIGENELDYDFTCEKQERRKVLSDGAYTCYELKLSDSYCNCLFYRSVTGIPGLMEARDELEQEMDAEGMLLTGLSLQYVRRQDVLEQDALFLTQKGAQDYLKAYGYNHKPDCHSWCMTAVRSPEYGTLLRIVQDTDWDALFPDAADAPVAASDAPK